MSAFRQAASALSSGVLAGMSAVPLIRTRTTPVVVATAPDRSSGPASSAPPAGTGVVRLTRTAEP
jgi:hypothetical protein